MQNDQSKNGQSVSVGSTGGSAPAVPVHRFTLVSWLSIYGRYCYAEFVKESDYASLESENAKLREALKIARLYVPLVKQQEAIDAVLSPNGRDEPRPLG